MLKGQEDFSGSRFPVQLLSLEGSSQGPGKHRGHWWRPRLAALIFSHLCGLFSVHHNGLEWEQESFGKLVSPDVESQKNLSLSFSVC